MGSSDSLGSLQLSELCLVFKQMDTWHSNKKHISMSSIGLMFKFFFNGILILLWKEKSQVQWAIHSQQSFQFLIALICEHSFVMHFSSLIDCNWADWFQLVSLNFYYIYNRVMLIRERIRNKERYPISLEQHMLHWIFDDVINYMNT